MDRSEIFADHLSNKNQPTPFPGAALTACAMLCGSLAAAVRRQNARRENPRGVAAENVARRAEGPVLTLGTRGSPLALAQAYEAKRRLGEARCFTCFEVEETGGREDSDGS